MKKFILILLVLAMLCPMAISCTGDDSGDDAVTTTVPGGDVTTAPGSSDDVDDNLDENGFLKDDLDQYNLNYNDDKVSVLNWKAEKPEFEITQTDGTKVNDAIYNRNLAIEDRLGVQLLFTEEAGNASNMKHFIEVTENAYEDKLYDIVATYSRTAGSLSIRGLYADLNEIEGSYLDFEKPWWPETLVETVTIGDALYFCSGDASTNVIHFMYTIFFNKTLKATYTDITEDFYDLVRNKQWTIDKLIDLSSGRYEDLDNDGKGANFSSSDLDDAYGFCTIYYGVDAFYTGAGLKLITQDEDDLLIVHDDYTGDKVSTLIEKLQPWLSGPDCVTFMGSGQYRQPFVNGNALFCQERAYLAMNYLTDVEFQYGILPTPLYNSKQADYRTIVGNPFTLYGISANCDSALQMTAVLECWASEGYRKTTPALFEETMKGRYADAPEDAEMWNTIKRTACFDLGRLFSKDELGYYIAEEPSKVACSTSGSWERTSAGIINKIQGNLEKIVEKYLSIQ